MGTRKTATAKPDPGRTGLAAYHAGPDEIVFAGRFWRIGQPQPMCPDDFERLTWRPDAAPFDFTFTEGAPALVLDDPDLNQET